MLRKGRLLCLGCVLLLAGCAAGTRGGGGVPADEIRRALVASAERWNEGDLAGFMEPYHESATYVGASGLVRGKEAITARYRSSYWREGPPAQRLEFTDLEVRPLGADHALVLGRYQLFDPAGALAAQGPFSLVFARTPDGWKIVHDHSS